MTEQNRTLLFALALVLLGGIAAVSLLRGDKTTAGYALACIVALLVRPPRATTTAAPVVAALLVLAALPGCEANYNYRLLGFRSSSFEMTPQPSNPVPSGVGGIYTKNTDNLPRFVDTSGSEYRAGDARHVVISAGPPGSAVTGDCWIDSTDGNRLYCKEDAGELPQRTNVAAAGSIGIAASPAVFLAHADSAAGTRYLGGAGSGAAASAQITLFVAHSAQAVRYLACTAGTAPGGSVSDTLTLQRSTDQGATWVDTTSTCTLTGTAHTCFSAAIVPINPFDWLAEKIDRNASSVSVGFNCEVLVN